MQWDGYIRVSRVHGREGASFISPTVQRDAIERLATAKMVELGEVVEELDVSGAKPIDERELTTWTRPHPWAVPCWASWRAGPRKNVISAELDGVRRPTRRRVGACISALALSGTCAQLSTARTARWRSTANISSASKLCSSRSLPAVEVPLGAPFGRPSETLMASTSRWATSNRSSRRAYTGVRYAEVTRS